jgi:hypothetical protein
LVIGVLPSIGLRECEILPDRMVGFDDLSPTVSQRQGSENGDCATFGNGSVEPYSLFHG